MSEREPEYYIDRDGGLFKEVRGGDIARPVAFEDNEIVTDNVSHMEEREKNRDRVALTGTVYKSKAREDRTERDPHYRPRKH